MRVVIIRTITKNYEQKKLVLTQRPPTGVTVDAETAKHTIALITATHSGHSANGKAQDIVCLNNAICAEMMSMTFHLLSVSAQSPVLRPIIFCAFPFAKPPPQFAMIGPSHALWETFTHGHF